MLFFGSSAPLPSTATGTMGTPAWIAITKDPFLKGRTPLCERVPSG